MNASEVFLGHLTLMRSHTYPKENVSKKERGNVLVKEIKRMGMFWMRKKESGNVLERERNECGKDKQERKKSMTLDFERCSLFQRIFVFFLF